MGYHLKLHLGVIDVPEPEGNTTFGVAKILEAKYGLYSKFAEAHIGDIANHLTDSLAGAMDTILQGGKVKDPFIAGTAQIDEDFRDFLDEEEMAQLGVAGVPTKAALMGKSIRFKRRVGARRPSFIDSGVLQANFKSWVDL